MTVRYVDYDRTPDLTPEYREDCEDWTRRICVSDETQARFDIAAGNVPAGVYLEWRIPGVWRVSDRQIVRVM